MFFILFKNVQKCLSFIKLNEMFQIHSRLHKIKPLYIDTSFKKITVLFALITDQWFVVLYRHQAHPLYLQELTNVEL